MFQGGHALTTSSSAALRPKEQVRCVRQLTKDEKSSLGTAVSTLRGNTVIRLLMMLETPTASESSISILQSGSEGHRTAVGGKLRRRVSKHAKMTPKPLPIRDTSVPQFRTTTAFKAQEYTAHSPRPAVAKRTRSGPAEPLSRAAHLPVDGAQEALDEVGQVVHLGALVGEDGAMQAGQLGEALQGVLGHVRVLPDFPVHL